jgi:hypothetical protein
METWKLLLAVISIIIAPLFFKWIAAKFSQERTESAGGLQLETTKREAAVQSIRENCSLVHKRVDEKLETLDLGQKEVRDDVKCVSKKMTKLLIHMKIDPGDST